MTISWILQFFLFKRYLSGLWKMFCKNNLKALEREKLWGVSFESSGSFLQGLGIKFKKISQNFFLKMELESKENSQNFQPKAPSKAF